MQQHWCKVQTGQISFRHLKLALHLAVRAVYVQKLAKSQGTRKGHAMHTTEHVPTRTEHVRLFTPQITHKGPQKRIGMHIIFYVLPAISDSQLTLKGLARRTYVTPAFSLLVTVLNWKVKVTSKQLRVTDLCLTSHLRYIVWFPNTYMPSAWNIRQPYLKHT